MLSLVAPWALWSLLALLPVLILYFLRTRFNRRPVGSLYVWRRLAERTAGGSRPRPRSLLLLALQLLVVVLAAASAAAPRSVSVSVARPGAVFLVDVSASMASEDVGGSRPGVASRVDLAAAILREELASLPEGTEAAVFACAAEARRLGEPGDSAAALAARLGSLAPLDEGFSEAAVAAAVGAWMAAGDRPWKACLLSDGGLDLGGVRLSASFGGAMRVIAVGSSGEGLGVARLRLEAGEARFQAWNGYGEARVATIRLESGGSLLGRAELELAPGWSSMRLALGGAATARGAPPAPGAYLLSIEGRLGPGASARLALFEPPTLKVLLVGERDPYLEAALGYEGLSLVLAEGFPASLGRDDAVLAIAAGLEAPAGLACDLLSFGPAPRGAPLEPGEPASGPIETTDPSHPLLRFVAWGGARAEGARSFEAGPGVAALAAIGGKTVLAAWEEGGYGRVACGIDLAASDLGLSAAFPILLGNVLARSRPRVDAQGAYTLRVGEIAYRGEPLSFEAPEVEAGRRGGIVGLRPRRAGFFAWRRGAARGFIAANVPPAELDATPRRLPGGAGAGPPGPAAAYERRERSLEAWPLALLALLLAAEWLLWRGPPRLRREGRP